MQRDNTAFLDLLFNLLLGFIFLFFISFMMIKPMMKKADAKNKAEYVISVTWPDNNKDDIDTWIKDPQDDIVWFREKEKNLSHLDRDDLGHINDTIVLPDGTIIECPLNQELVSIRGFIPGEWILNIHAYRHRETEPTPVKVSIDKINPSFKTVFFKEITIIEQWQEETVTRFTMTSGGDIIAFDAMPKKLVLSEAGNYPGGGVH